MQQKTNPVPSFLHVFLTFTLLIAVVQFNWMAERSNYKDAFVRMAAAPVAGILSGFMYMLFSKLLARLSSADAQAFFQKVRSFFPLLYSNIFLLFFPGVTENVLFFEFVLFLCVHLFALSQLTQKASVEKLCTFFLFLALSLVLCEFSLRAYNRVKPSFIFSSRSYDRFRMKPHSTHFDFKVNAGGFNDTEFTARKKAGTTRIIGLGDSFLFGLLPYKYNFFTLLEEKLITEGEKAELYNMGIPGMSIDDYYNLLMQEALTLKPDVVLCHVFVQNDIKNYYASFSYSTNTLFHFKEWYLYRLMETVFRIRTQYKGRVMRENAAYDDNGGSFNHETYLQMKWDRYEIFDVKTDVKNWHQSSMEILSKMQAILQKNKIRFLVVLIPDEIQVSPELQSEFLRYIREKNRIKETGHASDFDFELPQKNIKPYLKENHIDFYDLLPAFKREAQSGTRLYIPDDGHWNIAGNKLAAQEIHRELAKLLNGTRAK